MNKIFCLVFLLGQTFAYPRKEEVLNSDSRLKESPKNARYYFSADVNDEVSDLKSHRHELRYGVEVIGSFSYSDGFVYREVKYSADQNGYRVISDKMENISQTEQKSNKTERTSNFTNSELNSTLPNHRLSHAKKLKTV